MKKFLCILLSILICFTATFVAANAQDNTYKKGDVDLDGSVNIFDVTAIQLHLAKYTQLTDTQRILADVDIDGNVNIFDATIIQLFLAEIISEFPQPPTQATQQEASSESQTESQVETSTVTEHTEETTPTETQPSTESPCVTYARKLKQLQGENTLTLSMMADVHFDKDADYSQKKIQVIEDMGKIQELVDVDLTCVLGDVVVGNSDKDTTLSSLTALMSAYDKNIKTPLLPLRGNHDDNGWYSFEYGGTNQQDEIINDEEWWNTVSKNLPSSFVVDENKPHGGYGYYDHEDTKTRVFMLNSSDFPYITEEDGSYRYNGYQIYAFSNEQLNFVANSLMFSDKEVPNDWAALFLVHIPLDSTNAEGKRFGGAHALTRGSDYMLAIIDAYRKGTAFSASGTISAAIWPFEKSEDFNVNVNIDYSDKGCGEVISFVSGHTHFDNYSNEVGGKNTLSYGYSYISIVASTSFASLVVDRNNNTISVLQYKDVFTPTKADGVITSEVSSGSIESGEWTIDYSNTLEAEDLYKGLSEFYPVYRVFDVNPVIDLETLELTSARETPSPLILTKAIPVKTFTTYVIPSDYHGFCLSFSSIGYRRSFIEAVDHGDYKTITTPQRTAYLVFDFDTHLYSDYKNFYIKELNCAMD